MKKILVTSICAAAMVFAAPHTTWAQDEQNGAQVTEYVPIQTTIICIVVATGDVTLALGNGETTKLSADASGDATFTSVPNAGTPENEKYIAEGRALSSFSLDALTIKGSDPVYGEYVFTANLDNAAENSTVVANEAGALFPATANIYANVSGTISGIEGTFTNRTACHMRTENLNTFNPQVNEAYTFVDDVEFSNENGDTFTIPAGASVTLN